MYNISSQIKHISSKWFNIPKGFKNFFPKSKNGTTSTPHTKYQNTNKTQPPGNNGGGGKKEPEGNNTNT